MTGTRIWALGTTIIIVAVLALGWLLGVSPMLGRLSMAEEELANAEANNQAQTATLEVMKAQYENLDELRDELEVLRIAIPGAIDSDFLYALLANYQVGTGTVVSAITTGEPQPYGTSMEGSPTAEGVTAIPNLYTLPVTITFADTPADQVMAFVANLQRGPRLFVVTGVSSSSGEGGAMGGPAGQSSTITAYMFILADPKATAEDASIALLEHGYDASQVATPLGPKPSGTPTATPSPTPTPDSSPTATPAPTPTP